MCKVKIKGLIFIVLLVMLVGCGQIQSEKIDKGSEGKVVSVLADGRSYLSFSWIEHEQKNDRKEEI